MWSRHLSQLVDACWNGTANVSQHELTAVDGSGLALASGYEPPPDTPPHALDAARSLAEHAALGAADEHRARFGYDAGDDPVRDADRYERARLCAFAAYVEYRSDVYRTLRRLVDRSDRGRWRAATAFAEVWLRRKAFELLFDVAYIQYEPDFDAPEPDDLDEQPAAEADDDHAAADAVADLEPPASDGEDEPDAAIVGDDY